MSWEAISAIATVIGAAVVIWQLWNLTKQQNAAAAQAIVDGERALWELALSYPDMTAALGEHFRLTPEFLKQLPATERVALITMLFFRQYESIYFRHENGTLPPDLWEQWRHSMIFTFRTAGVRALFERTTDSFTPGFKQFVTGDIIPEADKMPRSTETRGGADS